MARDDPSGPGPVRRSSPLWRPGRALRSTRGRARPLRPTDSAGPFSAALLPGDLATQQPARASSAATAAAAAAPHSVSTLAGDESMERGRARGRRRPRPEPARAVGIPRVVGTPWRVGTAAVLAALLAARADACASHAAQTLSTSCGGLCGSATPCLAFNASAGSCAAASCVSDASDDCAFECLYPSGGSGADGDGADDADLFAFLVEFGSFRSAQETEARKRDSAAFEAAVAALGDDSSRFPSASNDDVAAVGALALDASVSRVTLAGGPSASESVKYKVARVALADGALANQTGVSAVALRNLALADAWDGEPAPVERLPAALPRSLTNLTLANALLSSFPALVANFSSLVDLNLDMNDISSVAGTDTIVGLRSLSMQDNALQVFRPVFPYLETLHLERNNLSAIPQVVFVHGSLRALFLSGNPLSSPSFTTEQADFLEALETLDLNNADFSAGEQLACSAKAQRTVHNLTLCVSDAASNDDDDESSDDSSDCEERASSVTAVVVGSVGGAVLLVILVIAGAWLYLARARRHLRPRADASRADADADADADANARGWWMARGSLFGGGVSPPLGRPSCGTPGSVRKPYGRFPDDEGGGAEDACVEDGEYGSDRVSTRSTRSNNSSGVYSVWSDPDLLSLQVRFEDIEDIGTIGSGAYGVVFLVRYRGSQLLASKRLRADQVTKQRTQDFVEEIKLVSTLDHPNIVRFSGAAWTIESNLQALFEYMENGDLRDFLLGPASPRHWSQEMLQLAIDVVEALVYVHSFTPPLLHRDLKARNVLLSGDLVAKVTDFGAARYKSMNDTMTAGVGTGRWLAPEVIQGQSDYDQSADVFSFGVVLAEMDSHGVPYDHVRSANGHKLADIAILQMVATGQLRPSFSANCPPELRLLALRCMAQRPQDRPPAHVVAYELRTLQRSLFAEL